MVAWRGWRAHPVLGLLVHVVGADLDLHRQARGQDHRVVHRLVAVALRVRDIVLAAARLPPPKEAAENVVRVVARVVLEAAAEDDADGEDVVDPLLAHDRLVEGREEPLGPHDDASHPS